jgi:glutathione S-transferase
VYLPRPDVVSIGTNYRRIPLLSIGRDIYNDTRLILRKLEELFPAPQYPSISSTNGDHKAIEFLLEHWAVDEGLFKYGGALIPTNMPLLNDPKFTKDREQYSGRSWSKENVERGRPEALVEMLNAFHTLEDGFLADGREWILKTDAPSTADIEAVWAFHWAKGLPGALPKGFIDATIFPKTYAWIVRFDKATKAAEKKNGKPNAVKGDEARKLIEKSTFAEKEGEVDPNDPIKLQKGAEVEVWPTDTGFSHKDQGKLVSFDRQEIVIEGKTEGGVAVRIHTPRHGFRIRAVAGSKL